MLIQDFKQALLNKTLNDDLIIFVYSDNSFIADSYIKEICLQKNLTLNYINSLSEVTDSALSLVLDATSDLNILRVGTFEEELLDYTDFQHCVVVCKKINSKIKSLVEAYITEIPKLVDWQIKDYIKAVCPGLTIPTIDWFYEACCHDIYKIDSELSLLKIAPEDEQEETLKQLSLLTSSDLFIKYSVFELVDALIRNNKQLALNFLKHADYYSQSYISSNGTKERSLDAIGLVSLTLQKYKNILLLNYKSGVEEKQLGLSSGAIWHLKNDTKQIPLIQIMKAIDFLSGIDSRLKANPSKLDFIDNRPTALLEYIILGALACCA